MIKKSRTFLFSLLGIAALLFIFRDTLLRIGVERALYTIISKDLHYEALTWENGKLHIRGITAATDSYEVAIEQIDAGFSLDFFPLYFETQLSVVHPEVILASSASVKEKSFGLAGIFPTKYTAMKVDILDGVLQIEDQRLFFMFKSGDQRGKIGTLSFTYDRGEFRLPFLLIEIEKQHQKLLADIKVQQVECSQMLHLAGAFYPEIKDGWEEMRGEVELSAKGEITFPLQCERLDCIVDLRNLSLVNARLGIQAQADAFHGEVLYPSFLAEEEEVTLPLWKQVIASLSIERGEVVLSEPLIQGEWGLQDVNALLQADPSADPSLELKGALLHKGKRYPLVVGGKGTVHEDQTFWLEFAVQSDRTEAFFSLCSPENGSFVLQGDLKNVSSAHIELAQELTGSALPITLSKGELDGKVTLWAQDGEVKTVQFDEVKGRRVHFACQAYEAKGSIETFSLGGRLEQGELTAWESHFMGAEITAEQPYPLNADGLEIDLSFEEGQLNPSYIKGLLWGMPGIIDIKGSLTNWEAELSFCLEDFTKQGEKLHFGCESTDNYQSYEGWFRSEKIGSYITAPILKWVNPDLDLEGDLDLFGTFNPEKIQLSLQGTDIHLYHPFAELHAVAIGEKDEMLLKTEGRGEFTYDIPKDKWTGNIPLAEACFVEKNTGLIFDRVCTLMTLDDNKICFTDLSADCEGIKFKGRVDLNLGDAVDLKIVAQRIEGSADALRKIAMHFPSFAHFEVPLQGELLSGEQGLQLLSRISKDGSSCSWNFSGGMKKAGMPINQNSRLQNVEFDFQCSSANNSISVQNLRGQLASKGGNIFQLKSKRLCFTHKDNWKGDYDISLSDNTEEILRVAGTLHEKDLQRWECAFDSALTHFFGSKLHISRLVLQDLSQIEQLELQPTVKCRDLYYQLCFLSQTALLSIDKSALEFLRPMQLEGSVLTHFRYQGDALEFRVEGKGVKIEGSPINLFRISGEKIGSEWVIENLQADDLFCTTAFADEKESIRISLFEMSKGPLKVHGEGVFQKKAQQLLANIRSAQYDLKGAFQGKADARGKVEMDLPAAGKPLQIKGALHMSADLKGAKPLHFYNEGEVSFHYTPSQGLKVKQIDVCINEAEARFTTGELAFDLQTFKGSAKKLYFTLSPEVIETFNSASAAFITTALSGVTDLEFGKDFFLCQGSISDGAYKLGEKTWDLKQVIFRWDAQKFSIACKTVYQSLPFLANLQLDYSSDVVGMLKVQENPQSPGMKALFKVPKASPIDIHSIQGSFSGLEVNFTKSTSVRLEKANVLTGNVKIDAKAVSSLLPKQVQEEIKQLKLGKGYELKGNLILWKEGPDPFHFSGSLKGQEFSVLGCQFQDLDAQTEITPHDIFLQNVTVVDRAGILKIKQVNLTQDGQEWKLDIPLVQVQDLKPSQMKKIGVPENPLKPLLIRNLSFFNISGIVGKASTFKGNGHFNFTNAFKKESNLLDIPLEMIKNLGLDLGLLTPIHGEIEVQLIGDKFYVTEMKNMYSEGKRSEFYLASDQESSYMDLKGNLHLDFKMKQDVLLKITEPFILTVRGTLEKPRYGFQ